MQNKRIKNKKIEASSIASILFCVSCLAQYLSQSNCISRASILPLPSNEMLPTYSALISLAAAEASDLVVIVFYDKLGEVSGDLMIFKGFVFPDIYGVLVDIAVFKSFIAIIIADAVGGKENRVLCLGV